MAELQKHITIRRLPYHLFTASCFLGFSVLWNTGNLKNRKYVHDLLWPDWHRFFFHDTNKNGVFFCYNSMRIVLNSQLISSIKLTLTVKKR